MLLSGCWPEEAHSDGYVRPLPCECSPSEQFSASVDVQPSIGITNRLVATVCRRGECFVIRDGAPTTSGLSFSLQETPVVMNSSNTRRAWISGRWPSAPAAADGDVLEVSIVDYADGRTLADTSLTLAARAYEPAACVPVRPLNCTALTSSSTEVGFPRPCSRLDCSRLPFTELSLEFDPEQYLTEAERTSSTAFVARACQDDRCLQAELTWQPATRSASPSAFIGSPRDPVTVRLGSAEPASSLWTLRVHWIEWLGAPGAGTTYALELHRGHEVTATSLIVERRGAVEVVPVVPRFCHADGFTCESFGFADP